MLGLEKQTRNIYQTNFYFLSANKMAMGKGVGEGGNCTSRDVLSLEKFAPDPYLSRCTL